MSTDARNDVSLRGRPLHDLERHGQVVWLSYLRRGLFAGDHLSRLIDDFAVSGVRFDADLYAHAVAVAPDYAEPVATLLRAGRSPEEVLEELLIEDVSQACRALRDARPAELGGWVAVSVPPRRRVSVDEISGWATQLKEAAGSDRLLVGLPASQTGLRAVEGVVAAGHSVYVDQVSGLEQLDRTLDAYSRGLRLRLAAGGEFATVRLVAALDLVRIDVAVDELLRARRRERAGELDMIESLHGRAGIAVAKLAWNRLREWDSDDRWAELAAKGARPAWLAWEGTRTSSPARRDVEYLEELIGPRTIAVVSRSSLGAFRDHGETAATVSRQLDDAAEILEDLRAVGIDVDVVATELQEAALLAWDARGEEMLASIAEPREANGRERLEPGALGDRIGELERQADDAALVRRLWERDPTLWPAGVEDPGRIRDRLGWLGLPEAMTEEALPVLAASGANDERPVSVVLLGMGGSSLGAEACRIAFGRRKFVVLDTTVPRGIASVTARADTGGAVFLVSSKSGTTVETLALADFFWERAEDEAPGERWVAITDPGTPLHEIARQRGFQRIWINPPDIGGRYSVLSYFGLVPMALMGIDIGRILASASRMAVRSGAEVRAAENPAVELAALLTAGLEAGRNKLTLLTSPRLGGLGDWIEQLVAESTGKEGRGLVPVSQEPIGAASSYGSDRLFVQIRLAEDGDDPAENELLDELSASGAPVMRYRLTDAHDLGAEFLRWQLAVALVGALAGFDPFDEPDVSGAKRRTGELLLAASAGEGIRIEAPVAESSHLAVHATSAELGSEDMTDLDPVAALAAHLRRARVPDYVAIQAFLAPDVETWHALQGLRALIRDRLGVATTVGWGPRFLHSTGQLHKGGGGDGLFLQLTAEAGGDLEIPERDYSFGTLAAAQATADLLSLRERGMRAVRVHFPGATEAGIASLLAAIDQALD